MENKEETAGVYIIRGSGKEKQGTHELKTEVVEVAVPSNSVLLDKTFDERAFLQMFGRM